jgi:hypothetical protein
MTDDQAPEIKVVRWEQTPAEQQEFRQRFLLREEAIFERRRAGLPTAQQAFASMAKIEIAPRLRELGFKGSGQKFRLPSDTHLLSLDFQRSAWNDILEVSFTINLSAGLIDSASIANEVPQSPRRLYSHDERLGFLSHGRDHWWKVPADGPTLSIAVEVIHDIRELGIPWLREQTQGHFTIPWLPQHARD